MGQPGHQAPARILCALCVLCGALSPLAAEPVRVADLSQDGVKLVVDAEPPAIDLGRDFFVTLTLTAPPGAAATLPDLRERFRGFRVAEDFSEAPVSDADGRTTYVTRWRLEPDPCAKGDEKRRYRLAPFVVTAGDVKFVTRGPVLFAPPAPREPVTGGIEIDPKPDAPPFSWKTAGIYAAVSVGVLLVLMVLYYVFRKIRQAVRVYRMSPIERAFYELDKLLRKGLPGRGLYKDFYVELTMVVRRYIERQYGVRAPHLTTDEFLREAGANAKFTETSLAELKVFLESADLVKFAGLEATPEMADGATGKARGYLTADAQQRKEAGK